MRDMGPFPKYCHICLLDPLQGRRKLNFIGKAKTTPMWVCPDMCWDAILCIFYEKKTNILMVSQRSEITAIDNEMSNYKNYLEEPNMCSELTINSFAMASRSRESVISL